VTQPAAAWPRWAWFAAAGALAGLLGFVLVTIAIYGHGPLLSVDTSVEARFASHRAHWLTSFLNAETATASFYVAAPLLITVSAALAVARRSWRPLAVGGLAVALLAVSVGTGKEVIGRSRDSIAAHAFGDGGTSYPSGHTTTAVVVGGCLVLLFADRLSARARRWCLVAVGAYALLTGFSRVYLHDHWFTDVLAGWLLGTAIVCLLALAVLGYLRANPVVPGASPGR
jgi:membrane-associated phospholipid phosphatase